MQPPRAGSSISADGHTVVVMAGAKGDPTAMVAVADTLKAKLKAAGSADVDISLTGASGIWSDFVSRAGSLEPKKAPRKRCTTKRA